MFVYDASRLSGRPSLLGVLFLLSERCYVGGRVGYEIVPLVFFSRISFE